jgi:hypothetical protein
VKPSIHGRVTDAAHILLHMVPDLVAEVFYVLQLPPVLAGVCYLARCGEIFCWTRLSRLRRSLS